MNEINWTKTKDSLPAYGSPVLIIYQGAVQHITYMLDGCDHSPDWFAPYHFDGEDDLFIEWNKVDAWVYIDSINGEDE